VVTGRLSQCRDGVTGPASPLGDQIHDILSARGMGGALHVQALDDDREAGVRPDTQVVLASTFKLAVAVELYRQAAAESLDLTTRVVAPAAGRAPGLAAISAMSDDVELSLRDAAYSMMALGDNAATDAVIAEVGLDRVQATLIALGLTRTVVMGDCAYLWATLAEDLGFASSERMFAAMRSPAPPAQQRRLTRRLGHARALRATETSRSTPRDMTRLLRAVWRGRELPAEACERVRDAMRYERSAAAIRLGSGVRASVKAGTLAGVVFNEVGVIEFEDREAYAFAFFARCSPRRRGSSAAAADATARAIELAVECLRADAAHG
jgi:beta-lactamase class A